MVALGHDLTILAWGLAAFAMVGGLIAIRGKRGTLWQSVRGAMLAVAMLTTLAVLSLEYLLVTSNFSALDVANETSRGLPLFYKMAALWAGNDGSLLFWVWILSLYAAYVAWRRPRQGATLVPYAALILDGAVLFYLGLVSTVASPFATISPVPYDGGGLSPLLQNVWMAIHPPNLYMGYIGLSVPFAFGMAGLWSRQGTDQWMAVSRRWLLVAWMFLTAGLLLGGYWAYTELGWGGYWAWDPVENAAFMPWLTTTALLHSGMIQERRGMFKMWNAVLLSITFLLTIFGTFLTRSGFLPSVHTFANSPIAGYFFGFLVVGMVFATYMIYTRRGLLREEHPFDSMVSREGSFMVNNILLLAATLAVFWGTMFPIISSDFLGQSMTVSEGFFNSFIGPIGVALVVMMGIGAGLGWRRTEPSRLWTTFRGPLGVAALLTLLGWWWLNKSFGFVDLRVLGTIAAVSFSVAVHVGLVAGHVRVRCRSTGLPAAKAFARLVGSQRHRYGGFLVHIGVGLMLIGITGSWLYQKQLTYDLHTAQTVNVGGTPVTYVGNIDRIEGEDTVVSASLRIPGGSLVPSDIVYPGSPSPIARVAISRSIGGDLYAVLQSAKGNNQATLVFYLNPLIDWLWVGVMIAVLGAFWALSGRTERLRIAVLPGAGAQAAPEEV